MPFRLTGAPLTFADMTAKYMADLLVDGTMELFVDEPEYSPEYERGGYHCQQVSPNSS